MLEISELAVWLPDRGQVLEGLDLSAAGGIHAVVGRRGAGSTTVLRAVAGDLPGGTVRRGQVRLCQVASDAVPAGVWERGLLRVADRWLPRTTVAAVLGALSDTRTLADEADLREHLHRRVDSLPWDLRAHLLWAILRHAPARPLVLADQIMSAVAPDLRDRLGAELRRRAADGATVLWAEHDLDAVWEHADHISELVAGRVRWTGPTHEWRPRTLPAPTLLGLAREYRAQPVDLRDAAAARRWFEQHPPRTPPPAVAPPIPATTEVTVSAAALDLAGADVEIRTGESLGIVTRFDRAEPLARRLIGHISGVLVSTHLPSHHPVGRLARRWEDEHLGEPGSVLASIEGMRPRTSLAAHGTGDAAALRTAMARAVPGAVWFPHAQAGLDAHAVADLAAGLLGGHLGPRIITSRDPEFLVRACHRIMVVDAGEIVAVGSPHAVARFLPDRPLVSRVLGTPRHVRLGDITPAVVA